MRDMSRQARSQLTILQQPPRFWSFAMEDIELERLRFAAENMEDPVLVPRKALNTAIGLDKDALGLLREMADKNPPAGEGEPLHPASVKLVADFAAAMTTVLHRAQRKYNHGANWRDSTWMDKCRADLQHYVDLGDPVLAGVTCAFLWYHQEQSARTPQEEIAAMAERLDA